MYGLGMTGGIGINLFVGRVVRLTVRKTHFRLYNSVNLFEEMLRAPETSSGQIYMFKRHIHIEFVCAIWAQRYKKNLI
jgi:hypothetical protein